jgi:DNA primase
MLSKDSVIFLQNSKHDIVKVLEHYGFEIPHARRGWFTLRCAFHGDKVKSARLNIDNGGFRCFGCDMAGDVYSLIMKKEGVAFNEAKQIAERITGESNGELRKKPSRDSSVSGEQRYHSTDSEYVSPRLRKRA